MTKTYHWFYALTMRTERSVEEYKFEEKKILFGVLFGTVFQYILFAIGQIMVKKKEE